MRVKSRWNKEDRERTVQDIASALGFIMFRIATNAVLKLENEGFQTDTQMDRMNIVREYLAFLLHIVDRKTYDSYSEEDRQAMIGALAAKLSSLVQDNMRDINGPGEYRQEFIKLLNARAVDYAEFGFTDDEPAYGMSRLFGESVTAVMGPKDRKWVATMVIEVQVPEALKTLNKAARDLLGD